MQLDLEKLKKEQIQLSKKVILKDSFAEINTIAGCDQAYFDKKIISAIVVCNSENFEIIEKTYAFLPVRFPYIAGFLAYRESPAIIEAFNKLESKPDILLIDGNGILHPRKFGLACHIGLSLDIPTLGVTKTLLIGELKDDTVYVENKPRAIRVTTKKGSNPVYVSPGYKISLKTSAEIAAKCIKPPHKLPEPLALAHKYADKIRKNLA